jgi:hypothetical protein
LKDIIADSFDIFNDKTVFSPDRCKKCRWLNLCGSNMRFFSPCHSRGSGNLNSHWILEPACYMKDEEIEGKQNEFVCQNAKA